MILIETYFVEALFNFSRLIQVFKFNFSHLTSQRNEQFIEG